MISEGRAILPLNVGSIRKLAYDRRTKYYITLFRNEVSAGVDEDGILAMDYSSGSVPTTAQATYQQAYSSGFLWDMCLNGSSRYTASGFDWSSYHNYYFWQDDIISNASSCANYINYNVVNNNGVEPKPDVCLSNVVGWIVLNFIPNMDPEIHVDNNGLLCN